MGVLNVFDEELRTTPAPMLATKIEKNEAMEAEMREAFCRSLLHVDVADFMAALTVIPEFESRITVTSGLNERAFAVLASFASIGAQVVRNDVLNVLRDSLARQN